MDIKLKCPPRDKVAAIVLAAGLSRRMQASNKLLVNFKGRPLLTHAIDALLASRITDIIVVTGHQADAVQNTLTNPSLRFIHNPGYEEGLSTSLRRGLGAVPANTEGVLICLGDMPLLETASINTLLQAFEDQNGNKICLPVYQQKRGNPVLWPRQFFTEILQSSGDAGARWMIKNHPESVHEVPVNDEGIFHDIDTLEDLLALNS